jgi:hypothetical protein
MFISWAASGDGCGGAMVDRGFRYSMKGVVRPSGRIRWLGRNLSASALGVLSVWMKMLRWRVCGRRARHGCCALVAGMRGRRGEEDVLGLPVWACLLTAAAVVWCWRRRHVEGLRGRVVLDTRGAKPRKSLFDGIVVLLPGEYVVYVCGDCRCEVE